MEHTYTYTKTQTNARIRTRKHINTSRNSQSRPVGGQERASGRAGKRAAGEEGRWTSGQAGGPACEGNSYTVISALAGGMEGTAEELKADDGEYNNGEENEKTDLKQRRHRLQDRLEDDL